MEKELKVNDKQIIKGTLLLTVSVLLVKIFGLIYKVPLSYILSDEGMGYFNTAYSVYTFFYVISTAGVPKAISILTASNEKERADKISIGAFRSFFAIGLLLTLIFLLFSASFASALGSENSRFSMLAIAPSIAFVSASGALRGYFNGKLKLFPLAVSELITGISKLVFGLIFADLGVKMNLEIYEIAAFSILGITLGSFLGFIYLYITMKFETANREKRGNFDILADVRILKKVLKISIPLTLTAAIGSLINLLDVGIVMRMLEKDGFSELQANIIYGNYTTLAVPMFNLVATLLTPVTAVLLPILAKNSFSGNNIEFESKTRLSVDISLYITVPIAFLFFFYSNSILSFIFEDSSAKMASPLLSALSFSVILMGMLLMINTAIEGVGNYRIPLISLTVGSIAKLLISWFLISNDNFNILAAPIGTCVSYLVSLFISYFYINNVRKNKIPVLKTCFFTFVFSVFSLTSSILFDKFVNIENWHLKQILIYGIYAFVYFTLILTYVLLGKRSKKIYNCDKNCS